MLENIALIASVISALTAVTTSLRAVGKSREDARYDMASKIKEGCRTGNCGESRPLKGRGLLLYFITTMIWFVLSVIFIVPVVINSMQDNRDIRLFLWVLPFLALVILLGFIWRKIICK